MFNKSDKLFMILKYTLSCTFKPYSKSVFVTLNFCFWSDQCGCNTVLSVYFLFHQSIHEWSFRIIYAWPNIYNQTETLFCGTSVLR